MRQAFPSICLLPLLLVAWLVLAVAMVPAGAGEGKAPPLDRVSVQLVWVHQAQFAGFYMAQDRGIYRRYRLKVKIKPGGPGIVPLKTLRMGGCDFAVSWLSSAIVDKSRGAPLVNLAQLVRRSALLLVVFKGKGIEKVKDLDGRKVGMWGGQFSLAPRALFRRLGIHVQEVLQNVSVSPFLAGAVSAAAAMRYNEYHQLYQAGVDPEDLVVFDLSRLGVNFPEDGIYTTRRFWEMAPGVCRRFVRATLEGWRAAFAQPEEALESVMRRVEAARLATNRGHQRWMLGVMREIIAGGAPGEMGRLSARDFALVNRVLMEEGIIGAPVAMRGFAVSAWRSEP